jgi:hypothetical protein
MSPSSRIGVAACFWAVANERTISAEVRLAEHVDRDAATPTR